MSHSLTIHDATTLGETRPVFALEFLTERITVRELIRRRVYQDVKDYNAAQSEMFHGLVKPIDAEQTLNGYKLKKSRRIDWEVQADKAIEAFERNGFILLIDDQQAEELDADLVIRPGMSVTFLKLMPLVGG
ncbi:MAG: hypothetical protein HC795_13720 [Coleofasciculaceae cyanobacterium RL_1_1]|nr:hypothetical protein [Coleofasciculaceae cyanobacterium RL_1_1]